MNLLQIVRRARLDVDAIRADGSTSALWSDEEVKTAANSAMDRAARIIRLADSDLLTKTVKSTDASSDYITENYAASSMSLVAGTTDYTLPPDFVSVVNILPLSTGYDGIRFKPGKTTQRYFTDARLMTTTDVHSVFNGEYTYSYTIIGGRTIRFAPFFADSFDIEIEYRYRAPRLLSYSQGTVALSNGSTAIHGVGTDWSTAGLRTPMEIVDGAISSVVLDKQYQRISTLTDDTSLVLARAWTGSTKTTSSYQLAMVPLLPEEHHEWLARMTAALLLRKINLDLAEKSRMSLESELMAEIAPEITLRQTQESLPVEPYDP